MSPKSKMLCLGEQRYMREKKKSVSIQQVWLNCIPYMWRAIALMHRDIHFHILFYTELGHALFGPSSAVLCTCLDCCIHTGCSGASKLRTNSKTRAKVKNIKLEYKHDNMLFFGVFFGQRQIHKMLLAAASQTGIKTQNTL